MNLGSDPLLRAYLLQYLRLIIEVNKVPPHPDFTGIGRQLTQDLSTAKGRLIGFMEKRYHISDFEQAIERLTFQAVHSDQQLLGLTDEEIEALLK